LCRKHTSLQSRGRWGEPSWDTHRGAFESLTRVESPVGTPAEGASEPLDSTGAKGPAGTSTEGAVAPLVPAGVEGLRVTPTEGTGGSLPEVGTNEPVPAEGKRGSRYNFRTLPHPPGIRRIRLHITFISTFASGFLLDST